jgi:hypothetical protein
MTNDERDIQRKLRVLQHAEKIGKVRYLSCLSGSSVNRLKLRCAKQKPRHALR